MKITKRDVQGLVGRLELLAPRRDQWHSTLTRAAYRKGVQAGAFFDTADDAFPDNPYTDPAYAPNHHRGSNSPYKAFCAGSLDGQRIRRMLTNPAKVSPELRQSEYRLLPSSLQALADR